MASSKDARDAALFREFMTWMTRAPAFGAHSKREIELKVVELLYADRRDVTVADVAAELAVTRSRARNLLLEARVRQAARPDAPKAADLLRDLVRTWPSRGRFDQDGNRLRVVVDDPYLREVLKNYAYANGIDVDTTATGEIVTLTWASYVALLEALVGPGAAVDVLRDVGAQIRKQLGDDRALRREFDAAMKTEATPAQRFAAVARFATEHALPVASATHSLLR
jgi:hypothetical protein